MLEVAARLRQLLLEVLCLLRRDEALQEIQALIRQALGLQLCLAEAQLILQQPIVLLQLGQMTGSLDRDATLQRLQLLTALRDELLDLRHATCGTS